MYGIPRIFFYKFRDTEIRGIVQSTMAATALKATILQKSKIQTAGGLHHQIAGGSFVENFSNLTPADRLRSLSYNGESISYSNISATIR